MLSAWVCQRLNNNGEAFRLLHFVSARIQPSSMQMPMLLIFLRSVGQLYRYRKKSMPPEQLPFPTTNMSACSYISQHAIVFLSLLLARLLTPNNWSIFSDGSSRLNNHLAGSLRHRRPFHPICCNHHIVINYSATSHPVLITLDFIKVARPSINYRSIFQLVGAMLPTVSNA